MEVEIWPVKKLIPYARNPRKNNEGVKAVAESIKRFGFRNPVIVDKDGEIIAGHTRLKAANVLGLASVPVIRAEDLTPDQAKAFRLADNKAQELSSWDFSLLMDELCSITEYDMTVFGFAETEEKEPERRETRTSNLDDGYEVDVDSFAEESFSCTCPECGFKFNE